MGQVIARPAGRAPKSTPPGHFTLQMTVNGVHVEALIDTGCGTTLIRKAKGPYTPEVLSMQCLHGDVKEYRTKIVIIGIGSHISTCRVGVVPHFRPFHTFTV